MHEDRSCSTYRYVLTSIIVVLLIFSVSSLCLADDAMVLPKGRWMTTVGLDFYPTWKNQFNNQGETEALAHDYNRELDENVFEDLAMIKAAFGLERASFGKSIVTFEKRALIIYRSPLS